MINDREFASVLSLDPAERYAYFVKKVADFEELWSLWRGGGWAVMSGRVGECVPVWPHERFAKAYAAGDWAEYSPRRIDLETWLARWMAGLARDGRKVAVFPDIAGRCIVREPEDLRADLEEECSRLE